MGPLAVSPSAVTRDRPAVASTHHGTTTLSGYPPRDHHRHRQQVRAPSQLHPFEIDLSLLKCLHPGGLPTPIANTTQPHYHAHNRRTLPPTPTSRYRPPSLQYRPPHTHHHHNRPTHTYQTTEHTRPTPTHPHTQPLRPQRPPPPSTRPLLPPPPTHTRYIAPDGPTRGKDKVYFKILQALHHRDTADRAVSSRELPRGMSRQVHKRSHFIKPITHRHHITKK